MPFDFVEDYEQVTGESVEAAKARFSAETKVVSAPEVQAPNASAVAEVKSVDAEQV